MASKPKKMADLRVLVVDDNPEVCRMVRFVLQGMGITDVEMASNGLHAWNAFSQSPRRFDLVISDWLMPEMSGSALLSRIRRSGSEVPFLMLTAKAAEEDVAEALEAGVNGYVVKPFGLENFRKRVRVLAAKALGEPASD